MHKLPMPIVGVQAVSRKEENMKDKEPDGQGWWKTGKTKKGATALKGRVTLHGRDYWITLSKWQRPKEDSKSEGYIILNAVQQGGYTSRLKDESPREDDIPF